MSLTACASDEPPLSANAEASPESSRLLLCMIGRPIPQITDLLELFVIIMNATGLSRLVSSQETTADPDASQPFVAMSHDALY